MAADIQLPGNRDSVDLPSPNTELATEQKVHSKADLKEGPTWNACHNFVHRFHSIAGNVKVSTESRGAETLCACSQNAGTRLVAEANVANALCF